MKWQANLDDSALQWMGMPKNLLMDTIEALKTFHRIAKSDAAGRVIRRKTGTAIANGDLDCSVVAFRLDGDMNLEGLRIDAVTNGIFNQGLKQQLRYEAIADLGRCVDVD